MTITKPSPNARHGFAMLLVLISLAVATILATAYLASRDTSAMIGANISSGASARSAAIAGISAGVAVLETETNWRDSHTNGVVFTNASLAGASVDLAFMDLTTGAPPTDDTTDVEITATARVDGVEETVVAHAYVPLPEPDADFDLSEFVVFAKDRLRIHDTSLIARWTKSPYTPLQRALALGTLSNSAGAIELTDYAVAIDGVAYSVPGASELIVSNDGPGSIRVENLPDTVLVPDPPSPPLSLFTLLSTGDFGRQNSATFTMTNDRRVNKLTLKTNAILYMRGPITLLADDAITVDSGAKINIQGDVNIVAMKSFTLAQANIELKDGATLTVYLADSLSMDEALVGIENKSTRDTTGEATWMDPSRVTFYEYDPPSQMTWQLTDTSVFKGSMYAPTNVINVSNGSAIYGRVAALEVTVQQGSAIFYDHVLDTRTGYIADDSPVYDDDGNVDSIIVTNLTSLDDDSTVNTLLKAARTTTTTTTPINDPTPRTVHVTYEIVSMSSPIASWESKGDVIPGEE